MQEMLGTARSARRRLHVPECGKHYVPIIYPFSSRNPSGLRSSALPALGLAGPECGSGRRAQSSLPGSGRAVELARLESAETAGRVAIPGTDPCAEG